MFKKNKHLKTDNRATAEKQYNQIIRENVPLDINH